MLLFKVTDLPLHKAPIISGVVEGLDGNGLVMEIAPLGAHTFPSHTLLPAGREAWPCKLKEFPLNVEPSPCTSV